MPDTIAIFKSENLGEHPDTNIDISEIQHYKRILQQNGFIGTLQKGQWTGYDYGNISIRHGSGILISSSQTSGTKECSIDDFVFVVSYNPKSFTVIWYGHKHGNKTPSSETPLHWVAYKTSPETNAVIHGHIVEYDPAYSKVLGFFEERGLPLTQNRSKSNKIGEELSRLIKERGIGDVIGMNNHDGGFGLIAVDSSLEAACDKLIRFYKRLKAA